MDCVEDAEITHGRVGFVLGKDQVDLSFGREALLRPQERLGRPGKGRRTLESFNISGGKKAEEIATRGEALLGAYSEGDPC